GRSAEKFGATLGILAVCTRPAELYFRALWGNLGSRWPVSRGVVRFSIFVAAGLVRCALVIGLVDDRIFPTSKKKFRKSVAHAGHLANQRYRL
ncbi:MAG TPA: hypothetical protein VGH74_18050, partial [Planctomycetaceae bacterium]